MVLTGGPSSGKSSALALLRSRLTSRGFQVLTVPENATHFLANSDGFQGAWKGTEDQVRMQRIFLDYQIAQEDAFKAFSQLHPVKRAVLLLDCCTLNSKLYLTDDQWQQALRLPGSVRFTEAVTYTEEELFARYDLVVHMETTASSGDYQFGPGSNNPGRYHTPEEAKEQDKRCREVFQKHGQLRVVEYCQEFKEKIEQVLLFVNDALHVQGLGGPRRRRPCKVSKDGLPGLQELVKAKGVSASVITTVFLDDNLGRNVRQRVLIPNEAWMQIYSSWLEKSSARDSSTGQAKAQGLWRGLIEDVLAQASDFLYERRDPIREPQSKPTATGQPACGTDCVRRVIKKEDFFLDAQGASIETAAHKLVLHFMDGSNYFEIFFFLHKEELILDDPAEATLAPKWLEILTVEGETTRMLKRYSTEDACRRILSAANSQ